MKVSNSKFAKRLSYLLISAIFLTFIAVILCTITIYNLLIVPLFILLVYLFVVSKTTTIELSGGCITIRKNHPLTLNKFITPFFELPYSRLLGYQITNKFGISKLILKIESKRRNKFILKTSLRGFTNLQKGKIKASFASIFIPPDSSSPIDCVA
ncbi:hypothetical protein OMO38_19565 [Chryseobacterium sp. 09-1422]|uniref:DUF58 domain-containing protein n=1 Tax=Chryseobacterium kimseyorum TaxID=2984028 RepID=A0ABT3I3T9_9FLAO|nr:hypothetical protein [Chryseobacterium kimseyorum]MCW3170734.1 hypothetical protein [Chryseobacterium kimseyorum]